MSAAERPAPGGPPDPLDADLRALRQGRPPASLALLRYLEAPQPGWSEFLCREYLQDFISQGGTKVKLLVGTPGSGKSHLLALAAGLAREERYLVAELSASIATRIFPIDRFYGAVMKSIGPWKLAEAYAQQALEELGYGRDQLPARSSFLDAAVRQGLGEEALLRRSLRERVEPLLRTAELDPTFGVAMAQAVGHRLGSFELRPEEREVLTRWFTADKVLLRELKPLQIYKTPDRHVARDYLRSLATVARLAGYRGLVVCVDNLESVAHRSPADGHARYSRAQRDEAFETIRQLIDDVDRSRHSLYLLAGRREVLEDEKTGISSYEALRLRLLQEVRADRFNPYADVVDLNEARVDGYLSPEALGEWLERVREYHDGSVGSSATPENLSLRDLVLALGAETS